MMIDYKEIFDRIEAADAIVIGAGAGLSTAAGIEYSGERFENKFAEYIERYGIKDMYSAGFYPYKTQEEKWAYWSKHIYHNRYEIGPTDLYMKLYDRVKDKAHFVLTTNADHQFFLSGFEEENIFATQGDYGVLQCAKPCHDKLYDNESSVMKMLAQQKDCMIPTLLVPKCPRCGGDMDLHLRKDDTFVENEDWDHAHERYQAFIKANQNRKILFLEMGVGMNTPSIIKYPFMRLTYQMNDAFYISLNLGGPTIPTPKEIVGRSLCLDVDIADIFK